MLMTLWEFASEPPEATPPGECPLEAFSTDQATNILDRLEKPSESFAKPMAQYYDEFQSCICPEWFDGMLNADLALSLEICRFADSAKGTRLERNEGWIQTERDAHRELKGTIR
jgi:hypothetical protein